MMNHLTSQANYLTSKLEEFHMFNCNGINTPMFSGVHMVITLPF